ncbi:MAG: hypothetical protein ACYDBI_06045 [Thermoplasmataceae archaeon]
MTGIDNLTERITEALSPLIGTKIDATMGKKINKALGTMADPLRCVSYARLSKVKRGWKRFPKRREGTVVITLWSPLVQQYDIRFS